jgi:hypothetical protein
MDPLKTSEGTGGAPTCYSSIIFSFFPGFLHQPPNLPSTSSSSSFRNGNHSPLRRPAALNHPHYHQERCLKCLNCLKCLHCLKCFKSLNVSMSLIYFLSQMSQLSPMFQMYWSQCLKCLKCLKCLIVSMSQYMKSLKCLKCLICNAWHVGLKTPLL